MTQAGTVGRAGWVGWRWTGRMAGSLCAAGMLVPALAQELTGAAAVERATAMAVRGWGPRKAPEFGVASYGFGQVIDTPALAGVQTTAGGAAASGLLTAAGSLTLPGPSVPFEARVTDTANFIAVAIPGSRDEPVARDFVDSFSTVAVACGEFHTLLLKRDGTVVGRGWDGLGQATVPEGLTEVVAVACGLDHSVAIRSDGRAVLWGRNDQGQAQVEEAENHGFVAAAAGLLHTVLLRGDGTVHVTHPRFRPEAFGMEPVTDAVGVAAGASHTAVLRRDGSVRVFGRGAAMAEPVPVSVRDAVSVAAGGYFTVALLSDGSVVAWGDNTYGQTKVSEEAKDVVAVAAGSYHAVALRADGTVVAWGEGSNGALSIPPGLSDVVAVAAGGYHTQVLVRGGGPLSAPRRAGRGMQLDLLLPAGTRYRLESSSDLAGWMEGPESVARPGRLGVAIADDKPELFHRLRVLRGVRGRLEGR